MTQPIDQGVIKYFKAYYRKQVIQRQLRAIETDRETNILVLDALYIIKTAWHAVSPQTIAGFQ